MRNFLLVAFRLKGNMSIKGRKDQQEASSIMKLYNDIDRTLHAL